VKRLRSGAVPAPAALDESLEPPANQAPARPGLRTPAFLIPILVLPAATLALGGDALFGVVTALGVALLLTALVRPAGGLGPVADGAFLGMEKMVYPLGIVLVSFILRDVNAALGLTGFVIGSVQPIASAWMLPALVFVTLSGVAFATGSFWGAYTVSMPVVVGLATELGAPLPLTLGALVSAGAFGSRARAETTAMWGGRFESEPADAARAFTRSFPWDRRLYREDIVASRAHAAMLGARDIIGASDADALTAGLDRLLQELDETGGPAEAGDEDIHSYVERVLIERLGDAGRRLHTARSRNDQVATDMRLYVKGLTLRIGRALVDLMAAPVDRAEPDTVAPGLTHLQSGQPVTLGHYLLALYARLSRADDAC